jgi:hypothetical protein
MKTQWIKKQLSRINKFLILWPKVVSHFGWSSAIKLMSKSIIMHGFIGFKLECQRLAKDLAYLSEQKIEKTGNSTPSEYSDHEWIIYSPEFSNVSNGVFVLYKLCHDLNALGFKSFVTNSTNIPDSLHTPIISYDEALEKLKDPKVSVIYPETISGNPLMAKSVVRWVLNSPGLLGGETTYKENEAVFLYSEVYRDYVKNKIDGTLYVPAIDESIFYPPPETSARTLTCYYVGKSKYVTGHVDTNESFEITRKTPAKKELGKIFRVASMLYCFDNSTLLIFEALSCGCPVTIIPDGTHSKKDYLNLELGTDGIIWGQEGYLTGPLDVQKLISQYSAVKQNYQTNLIEFIKITAEKASKRS